MSKHIPIIEAKVSKKKEKKRKKKREKKIIGKTKLALRDFGEGHVDVPDLRGR